MGLKAVTLIGLALLVAAIAASSAFLLIMRKPVLGELVASSLSDWTRYGHRRWQLAKIGDALSAADAAEPTEAAIIRVRYTVDGHDYFKDLRTVVRKGERPEPTLTLWYNPKDPGHATDKGISWLGLGFSIGLLVTALVTLHS